MITRQVTSDESEQLPSLAAARTITLPRLKDQIASLDPDLARVCAYHFGFSDAQGTSATAGGGKLVRAGLVTASARALGLQATDVADLAAAVELLHNSTLLHDDIIDRDTTRRGRPTAWTVFGTEVALLAGDALQAAGLRTLAQDPLQGELWALFSDAIARVIAGQTRELSFHSDSVADTEEFERVAADKTSALLECSLSTAALRAAAPSETVSALRQAGYHLGVAWQASNDVEDIWGDPVVTGKPACGDLRQRTLNLPVLEVLAADGPDSAKLREMWTSDNDTQEHLDTLAALIAAAGGHQAAHQRSRRHLNRALACLSQAVVSQAGTAELSALFRLIVNRATRPETGGPETARMESATMTDTQTEAAHLVRTDYERHSQADWDNKTDDPINLRLGETDSLYHHHFAVGDFDPTVLEHPPAEREDRILAEMHRMENEQVELILQGLAPLSPEARVMDGGSGRGGTSFLINRRFDCSVHGINFCAHHLNFARRIGQQHGWDEKVSFAFSNMVDTGLPANSFDAIVTNETTMYVDLDEAFAEFARLLQPGGRYVVATWCANDAVASNSTIVRSIDEHYVCHIHRRSDYFTALTEHGLVPSTVRDLTPQAIPYWQLRSHSDLATGVEQAFLDGHRSGELNYLVIVTEKSLSG